MISFFLVCNGFCWAILLSPFSLFPRFGRHPVLILSVLFMLVFGLSVAFSVNVTMFSTLRFFEGFCLAGLALSLYVLSKYMLTPPRAFLFISLSCISLFMLCSVLMMMVMLNRTLDKLQINFSNLINYWCPNLTVTSFLRENEKYGRVFLTPFSGAHTSGWSWGLK